MNIKNFFESKTSKGVFYGITIVIVVLFIFQAGMMVGYHKAAFSYRWGDNYSRTFGESRHMIPGFPSGGFMNAHGATGKIIKIDLPTFIIESQDNTEKVIVIKDDTIIRRFRDEVKSSDLKVDDIVVVIGTPNDKGQVEAKFIRLMPSTSDRIESGKAQTK